MRTLLVAVTIALLATSAYAQGMRGSKRHGQGQRTEQPKPKADDKGYNAALSRIPMPEKKYDPWQSKR